MSKFRIATFAALAGAAMIVFFGNVNSAQAYPGVSKAKYGYHGGGYVHRGHGYRGGGYRYGGYNYGGAIAGIVGLAVMSHQLAQANQHREMMARIQYDRAANARIRAAKQKKTAQQQRDCAQVRQWQGLVNDAKAMLAKDIQMHAAYGEAVHSVKHQEFQKQELDRREAELAKAKARCAGAAA